MTSGQIRSGSSDSDPTALSGSGGAAALGRRRWGQAVASSPAWAGCGRPGLDEARVWCRRELATRRKHLRAQQSDPGFRAEHAPTRGGAKAPASYSRTEKREKERGRALRDCSRRYKAPEEVFGVDCVAERRDGGGTELRGAPMAAAAQARVWVRGGDFGSGSRREGVRAVLFIGQGAAPWRAGQGRQARRGLGARPDSGESRSVPSSGTIPTGGARLSAGAGEGVPTGPGWGMSRCVVVLGRGRETGRTKLLGRRRCFLFIFLCKRTKQIQFEFKLNEFKFKLNNKQ